MPSVVKSIKPRVSVDYLKIKMYVRLYYYFFLPRLPLGEIEFKLRYYL